MLRFMILCKSIALAMSASLQMVLEDPRNFQKNLLERIRLTIPPKFARQNSRLWLKGDSIEETEVKKRIRLGEFDKALSLIEFPPSKTSSRLTSQINRKIEHLDAGNLSIRPSKTLEPNSNPRLLFLFTNSVPFTKSGYTVRGHQIARMLSQSLSWVGVATRLAYPVTIGVLPKTTEQLIDGVWYHRTIPWLLPRRVSQRIQKSVDDLVNFASKNGVSIIHTTTGYQNAIVASHIAEKLSIPWIYEVRGELESTWLSKFEKSDIPRAKLSHYFQTIRKMEFEAMQSAAAVIVLSEISKKELIHRGIRAEKILVVPNGIEREILSTNYDKDKIREELQLPKNEMLIGSVTSVVEYEGLDDLILSLKQLPENYTALIVGDGSALPELIQLSINLGLEDRVLFVGRKPSSEIWKWYAAMDIFVVPRKNFEVTQRVTPIKSLIAQGLGIPVVASDLPALREITNNNASYFESENPSELAKALLSVSNKKDQKTNRDSEWLREHTWDAICTKFLKLYTSGELKSSN